MSRWLEIFRTGRYVPATAGDGTGPGDAGEGGDAVPERTDGRGDDGAEGVGRHAIGADDNGVDNNGVDTHEASDPADGLPAGGGPAGMDGTDGGVVEPENPGPARPADPIPGDPASWRRWYRRHVVLRSCLPRGEAGRRAYGLAQVTWHRLHGERPDPARCAGCGAPLAGRKALPIDGAASVHFDEEAGLDCVIRFGARWRGAAERGLRQMGIPPPRGWSN